MKFANTTFAGLKMEQITVRDKSFERYIAWSEIDEKIAQLATQIKADYAGKTPYFVGVLNGCFMFFGDLMKHFDQSCEIGFVKAASYHGMESTGQVKFHETGKLDLRGKDVIIVEDIVDTGNTLKALHEYLGRLTPNSLKTCTLLYKKEAYKASLPIDYVCFEVENKFLLGYGLDYDGLGRNTDSIYILKEEH